MSDRSNIQVPEFGDKFFKLDFEARPLPVISLYPIPRNLTLSDYRISVCGLEEPLRWIHWDSVEPIPEVTLETNLVCQIFNWAEDVRLTGIRLVDFLDYFDVETTEDGYYAIHSADGMYFETLSRDEARDPRVMLVYGLNGEPLPEDNGGPLRLVVPFLQGYKSVKWVNSIRAYENDPKGIKRLLGQSDSGHLNQHWKEKYDIAVPEGRAGDPPPGHAQP